VEGLAGIGLIIPIHVDFVYLLLPASDIDEKVGRHAAAASG